jgi:hypothetical protein
MRVFAAAAVCTLLSLAVPAPARGADFAAPVEGDFVARNFRFSSGETLPAVTVHYRTIGTPQRDASGGVRNAVLILHGTGGTGAGFLSQTFGWTRPVISSSCPTASATASRRSQATACGRASRNTPTTTWCARSTRCSSTG